MAFVSLISSGAGQTEHRIPPHRQCFNVGSNLKTSHTSRMSLIACTLNNKFPALIGDLAISQLTNRTIQLPTNTIDITPFLRPNSWQIVELYQKIYPIKNVGLALAGNVYEMQLFLQEFKIRSSYWEIVTENHIRSFLDEYNLGENFSKSAFFIMAMEHANEGIDVKLFSYPLKGWSFKPSNNFEGVYACGSGTNNFLYQLCDDTKVSASAQTGDFRRAISSNTGFIARLLASERISLYTLNDNWGGGFEIMFYNGHSFEKFDEIAYLIVEGRFDNKGEIEVFIPRVILHYKYRNDLLLITSLEIGKYLQQTNQDNITISSQDFKANLFVVSQLDRKHPVLREELPENFSFQTNRIAVGYAIITPNNGVYHPSFFSEGKDNVRVSFTDRESIEIELSEAIHVDIRKGAKETFPTL